MKTHFHLLVFPCARESKFSKITTFPHQDPGRAPKLCYEPVMSVFHGESDWLVLLGKILERNRESLISEIMEETMETLIG